jgi:hypothetical protein
MLDNGNSPTPILIAKALRIIGRPLKDKITKLDGKVRTLRRQAE